jgi:hypothetical protein
LTLLLLENECALLLLENKLELLFEAVLTLCEKLMLLLALTLPLELLALLIELWLLDWF